MALKFLSNACVTRPLTRSQQLIWTGQRLQPDDPLYNMAIAFTLNDAIDLDVFQASFQHVVQASEAMRTTFEHHAGVARQRFHEQYLYDVEFVDLTQERNPQEVAELLLEERTTQCFDLEHCLFDSVLVKLKTNLHIWYFNQHHLVTDASSTALIYRAVATEYARRLGGTKQAEASFPAFSDYVDYEQAKQGAKSTTRAQRYWQEKPVDVIESSSFYCELPAQRSGVTRRVPCVLGPKRIQRLSSLAASNECRALTTDLAQFQVFATLLFAWLYRVTGNHTLAFSMPTHNRGLAAHKSTPGLFIELYPLVVEVSDHDSFASLYKKVSRNVQQLLVNTGPGVSTFAINRDVEVVLNYITAEFGPFGGIPMSSSWVHPDSGDRNHLVRVQVESFDGFENLRVLFDLNEKAFPEGQRELPGEHFCALLDAFTEDSSQQLATIDLQSTKLSSQGPTSTAATPSTFGKPPTMGHVLEAFAEQVERVPHETAIVCEEHKLSYSELNAEARSFAVQLAKHGVEPGDRVAIVLPRSIEAVTAIYGTLMAGAVYVPVDTEYPKTRRSYIIQNAGAKVSVHLERDLEAQSVATGSSHDLTDATSVPKAIAVFLNEAPHPDVTSQAVEKTPVLNANATAYIIYTSGSTGQPKGVEVAHGSLANYIEWARTYYQPDTPLNWPLFSSLAFDLTVTSLFVPLCSGGTLMVYPESADEHDIAVRTVVEDNLVDIIKLTPAHLSLLQAMDLSTSRIQSLVVGGEDFRTELARSVDNYFGGRVRLFNEYGPTEGTVACAIHQFNRIDDVSVSVPIGHAISGCRLYVLNSSLLEQPPGVVGELYIAGAGVAQGYFKNDELTAERFIDSPFVPNETLYRTGDLARSRLDSQGNPDVLMCLGRVDHQLKVNGLRIEAGEIEQCLLQVTGIDEAVVSLHEPDAQDLHSDEEFCIRCGISSRHPSAQLDADQVCKVCHIYAAESQRAQDYFGDSSDLKKIVETIHAESKARPEGAPDCMMLLSGGKDSTYALCQVVDLGLKPLVFTLDNGFISQGAKDNMARVTEHLGVEVISGSTPAMNAIFRDSLNRFSNVCNGCFKTIYTLSLKIARERGIRHVFTGLSRGQIFETRVADLFRQGEFDIERIDSVIVEARKAYHRAEDAVSQLMDVSHFDDDSIFTDIEYVDYYRYTDVSLDTMLTYLKDRVPWVRPADTGRSTNCLINEAGIFVHKQERGFHNYSLPYSWDVRLGHKERDAAREELDDNINIDNVNRILDEIEYTPRSNLAQLNRRPQLVAHYVSSSEIDIEVLKSRLSETLPEGVIPSAFVHLDAMPLTANGKVDRSALPKPAASRSHLAVGFEAPEGQIETVLAQVWQQVFGIERIGVNDNFFELGGDSIVNIQIVASVAKHGLLLSPQQVFDSPTIRSLAAQAGTATQLASEQGPVTGEVPLTPIQQRFFSWELAAPSAYCQFVVLDSVGALDSYALQEALRQLVVHHDVLRARFSVDNGQWNQSFATTDSVPSLLVKEDLSSLPQQEQNSAIEKSIESIQNTFDLSSGNLFKAVLLQLGEGEAQLVLVAHHLIVDAVSWWVLLDDLEDSYRRLVDGKPVELPPKTSSMRHWSLMQTEYAKSASVQAQLPAWRKMVSAVANESSFSLRRLATAQAQRESHGSYTFNLDETTSRLLLTEVAANWRAQPQDLILTAFVETVTQWQGASSITLDIEAHGREQVTAEVDVLRTVGWFTSVYPISLEGINVSTDDPAGSLRELRDTLRAVQMGGVGYGALRYAMMEPEVTSSLTPAQNVPVVFNYLGSWRRQRQKNSLFHFAQPLGASFGASNAKPYVWEVNALFFDGSLQLTWDYSKQFSDEKTIAALASKVRVRLRQLIEHCAAVPDAQFTPQDFPNAGLDQSDLDDLLADYGDIE